MNCQKTLEEKSKECLKWRGEAKETALMHLTKERDVQTLLYIEGMNSICNALGYTEWVFATEEGGLVNRINESIRKLNDEGKKLNTELASCRDSRYQTNEKLIKSEYLKNERERELDFYMKLELTPLQNSVETLVQTSLYVKGMNSICKALGYTEWAFATEEGG